mgnify:CR=1 FL=1
MSHEERAKSLLKHYLRLTAESGRAAVIWDSEMDSEVDDLIECLIAAAQPTPDPKPAFEPLIRLHTPAAPAPGDGWIHGSDDTSRWWVRASAVSAVWGLDSGKLMLRTPDGTVLDVDRQDAARVLAELGIKES